jgi:hypothetical protein
LSELLPAPTAGAIPTTQYAIQFVGPGHVVRNWVKPVAVPGPTQVLLRVEAASICFSDTKLLKAFANHPRKAEVSTGIELARPARDGPLHCRTVLPR